MVQKIFAIVLVALLSGCASTYKHSELKQASEQLDPSRGVLIAVPEDGWYGETRYQRSGQMTANATLAAFSKNARKVDLTAGCEGAECLEEIDSQEYGYFVEPIILHWEDRATEWSGKPDRIEIQLIVYSTATNRQVANSSYTGKSSWFTFGGDHPQDLLAKPTDEFVRGLYR